MNEDGAWDGVRRVARATQDVVAEARALRAAQKDFLANRHDDARRKEVWKCTVRLDQALAALDGALEDD